MKNSYARISGYAVQNTGHVVHALRAYEAKAAVATRGAAIDAAIDRYAALSGKRVDPRTVRNWLAVARECGGIDLLPKNVFGALKSHRSPRRPHRRSARAAAALADKLCRQFCKSPAPSHLGPELAGVHRDLDSLEARLSDDPARCHLKSIRSAARRLVNAPFAGLLRHARADDIETALEGILGRIQAVAAKCAEKGLQAP